MQRKFIIGNFNFHISIFISFLCSFHCTKFEKHHTYIATPKSNFCSTVNGPNCVIRSFKCFLRCFLTLKLTDKIEKRTEPKIKLLDSINILDDAWKCITTVTIHNYFKKAGLKNNMYDSRFQN